jgi:hypothetical protein
MRLPVAVSSWRASVSPSQTTCNSGGSAMIGTLALIAACCVLIASLAIGINWLIEVSQ